MGWIGLRVYYHPHTDLKTQTNPHNIAVQLQECRYGYVLFGVMVSQEKSMCRRRSQNSIQPNWSLLCSLGMKRALAFGCRCSVAIFGLQAAGKRITRRDVEQNEALQPHRE